MTQHRQILVQSTSLDKIEPVFQTDLGQLFRGDCLDLFQALPNNTIDMVFADPPFNLGKDYGKNVSDKLKREEYLQWSKNWLSECVRVLKTGGTLFIFNLPSWLIEYGAFLNANDMSFRHWIACRMPKAFPRGKKLSPAHYGLLYYTKGEPTTFNKVYIPIPLCRHCGKEIRDYGGHRDKLNEKGLNLMDVFDESIEIWGDDANCTHENGNTWMTLEDIMDDIPPVRHGKYKTRTANELAPIMLERLITLSTNRGDLILDPFGGSGTTFYAAEKMERTWLGIELGDTSSAVRRLIDYQRGLDVEWESARGNGKRKRNGSDQLSLFRKEFIPE